MKRSLEADSVSESKRVKLLDDEPATDLSDSGSGFMNLDENLLYEVLKHADLRLTSAAATSSLDLWSWPSEGGGAAAVAASVSGEWLGG
ncbi:hypothetical protein LINPERHAP1_LOCUS31078 [Linum perenne]